MDDAEHNGHASPSPRASADATAPQPFIFETLCGEALEQLAGHGVDGLCISRCLGGQLTGLVYATDPMAEQLHELQTTLTESPGRIALRSHGPVLISDLRAEPLDSWMPFSAEAQRLGVHSVHAVPLQIGAIIMGLLTLHGTSSIRTDAALTRKVLTLADVLRIALLSPTQMDRDVSRWGDVLLSEGHIVTHQAAGMVMVQVRGTLEDALATIHAAAFSSGESVREVARRIVAREQSFRAPQPPVPKDPGKWDNDGHVL